MFTLPNLSYSYDALEPYIDKQTMEIHHDKHHAAYVKNLNEALAGQNDLLNLSIEDLLKDLSRIPEEIKTKVRNNGGGHFAHGLFWTIMTPKSSPPQGKLLEAINSDFGSFEQFKEKFATVAVNHFASGWVWLVVNKDKLEIMETNGHDSPLMEDKKPILVLDVWEHAYYLKYQNRRLDYIAAWWNVVNWEQVSKNFQNLV